MNKDELGSRGLDVTVCGLEGGWVRLRDIGCQSGGNARAALELSGFAHVRLASGLTFFTNTGTRLRGSDTGLR